MIKKISIILILLVFIILSSSNTMSSPRFFDSQKEANEILEDRNIKCCKGNQKYIHAKAVTLNLQETILTEEEIIESLGWPNAEGEEKDGLNTKTLNYRFWACANEIKKLDKSFYIEWKSLVLDLKIKINKRTKNIETFSTKEYLLYTL